MHEGAKRAAFIEGTDRVAFIEGAKRVAFIELLIELRSLSC